MEFERNICQPLRWNGVTFGNPSEVLRFANKLREAGVGETAGKLLECWPEVVAESAGRCDDTW